MTIFILLEDYYMNTRSKFEPVAFTKSEAKAQAWAKRNKDENGRKVDRNYVEIKYFLKEVK
jgi:hypothetical protein